MQLWALCNFWLVRSTWLLRLLGVYSRGNGHIGKSTLSNALKFFQKLAMCIHFQDPVLSSQLSSLLGFCYCFKRQEFAICTLTRDRLWHPFVRANKTTVPQKRLKVLALRKSKLDVGFCNALGNRDRVRFLLLSVWWREDVNGDPCLDWIHNK